MIYIELGDIHKSGSRHSDALRAYTRAVALEPDLWSGNYKRGVALYYLSQLEKAETALNEASKLNQSAAPLKLFQGLVALAQNRPEEAKVFLKEALKLEVNSPDIWFHLGQAHQRLGDWSEAKDSFEKAHDLNPRKSEVLYGLSEVNKKLGDREAARMYNSLFKDISQFEEERDVLEKKLWGKPNSTELRRDLATLLEKNDALEGAAEYLRQAAYLGDEKASAELERLEKLLAYRRTATPNRLNSSDRKR